ncbi:MAG: META domain-containing protein, partial [Sutterella sp.]
MSVKTLAAALLTSLVALSTQAYAQAPQLAGRSLMWAEVISEDCELPPELEISDKGELSGNTACNSITGKMTQEGDKVDFSQMGMTKRA